MTDSAAVQRELDYFRQVRADRYRPSVFRSIIRIDSSVPVWAERIVTEYTKAFAEFTLVGSSQTQFREGTEEKREEYSGLHQWGSAFQILDLEVERMANIRGWHITDSRRTANQQKSEQMLDQMAAEGDTLTGLKGLLNLVGISSVTPSTKTAGGTTFANGTFHEDLDDLLKLKQAVRTQSLGYYQCRQIVLPETIYNVLERKRHSADANFSPSVLDQFRKENPDVAVKWWARGATAGAGNTPRIVAMDTAEEVARMVIPQELTMHPPTRQDLGYRIVETFMSGGVLSDNPLGLAYMDGV